MVAEYENTRGILIRVPLELEPLRLLRFVGHTFAVLCVYVSEHKLWGHGDYTSFNEALQDIVAANHNLSYYGDHATDLCRCDLEKGEFANRRSTI